MDDAADLDVDTALLRSANVRRWFDFVWSRRCWRRRRRRDWSRRIWQTGIGTNKDATTVRIHHARGGTIPSARAARRADSDKLRAQVTRGAVGHVEWAAAQGVDGTGWVEGGSSGAVLLLRKERQQRRHEEQELMA